MKFIAEFLAVFKAFSTESLDDPVPGSISSLRRHSCTKNRGLAAAVATKRETSIKPN